MVLIPIKTKYAQLIFEGKKTIELRSKSVKFNNSWFFLVESKTGKKIRGMVFVSDIYKKKIKDLTQLELKRSCVSKTEILERYKDKNKIISLLKLKNAVIFKEALFLKNKNAVQGLTYFKEGAIKC